MQRHAVAAGVAHHAFRIAGGARCVEDVERIGRLHRHAAVRRGALDGLHPIEIATGDHRRLALRALQQDYPRHLVRRHLDRLVEQRLVLDDPVWFDTARRCQHELRIAVVDAARQLLGGKAAEHDGMHRAEPGAGEHRHHRFRNHRHVDDDPVTLAHALRRDHAGDRRHAIAQLAIGEALLRAGDRRIVDQRRLLGAAAIDVAVERVVAGIELAALEPAVERRIGRIEHLVPALRPVDRLGLLGPESLRVFQRARMQRAVDVARRHRLRPLTVRRRSECRPPSPARHCRRSPA
jgi:hypothetical protein